jgi:hypothetical protein
LWKSWHWTQRLIEWNWIIWFSSIWTFSVTMTWDFTCALKIYKVKDGSCFSHESVGHPATLRSPRSLWFTTTKFYFSLMLHTNQRCTAPFPPRDPGWPVHSAWITVGWRDKGEWTLTTYWLLKLLPRGESVTSAHMLLSKGSLMPEWMPTGHRNKCNHLPQGKFSYQY